MGSACSRTPDETRDAHVDVLPSPVLLQAAAAEEQSGHVIPSFPTAVEIEILSQLPIKSLARCQFISKEWRALIHEPYLTEMHLDRSHVIDYWYNLVPTAMPSVEIQSWFQRGIRNLVNRFADPVSYRHGCNGLIILANVNTKKHHVWNPAIRRTLELPDPHDRTLGFAFSYVPSTRTFRIVSFYMGERESKWLCCQVITPGVDTAWRELELPEAAKFVMKGGTVIERLSVVFSGGAVHYVQVSNYTDVVSLDLETEIFTVSRLPEYSKDYWDLDWDGKLGFAEVVGENLQVVELEDYKSGRWGVIRTSLMD